MQSNEKPARIFVVDDHAVVRQGIIRLIANEPSLAVCGDAGEVGAALSGILAEKPDVAIIDLSLGSGDGIELIKSVLAQVPSIRILVLTMHDDALHLERAVRAGARGFVTKQEVAAEILIALREVLEGRVYLSRQVSPKLLMQLIRAPGGDDDPIVRRLSDRELQVLRLIGQGKATKEIANALHLSVKTIESYRSSIKQKLDVTSALDLVHFAMRWVLTGEEKRPATDSAT